MTIVLLTAAGAAPAEAPATSQPTSDLPSARDYSGLDALSKAMAVEGVPVAMLDLLRGAPPDTSDFGQLAGLAEARGIHVTRAARMSVEQLHASKHPVVLRVWAGPLSVEPDRYVLYLKAQDGQALIYNPPNPDKLIPFHVLATRWDGTAWVVSSALEATPASGPSPMSVAYSGAACAIALLFAAGWARRRASAGRGIAGRPRAFVAAAASAGGLVAFAAALGFAYHSFRPGGLLFGGVPPSEFARVPVAANFLPPDAPAARPLPEITVADARPLVGSDVLFVDARSAEEFAAAHIDGAIHVPSFAAKGRRLSLAGIPRDTRIIVYCINAGCPRAHSLANALRDDGFDAWVLQGGWEAWGKVE